MNGAREVNAIRIEPEYGRIRGVPLKDRAVRGKDGASSMVRVSLLDTEFLDGHSWRH